ncbi:hypothetical protein R6Q59_030348 [Mikania micrantha]
MSSIEAVNHLQIPLQELSDASNGFSDQNIIAKGGFGNVYKGESVKHGKIAIKMLDPGKGQGDHEFRTEISLLSLYKHENIASLIGFCNEDQKKILVYRYEGNGSLDKHLSNAGLTWVQRLQICLDAARGLQYLHDDVGADQRILHRDVKSANILLDENWKAKISDFGLCRVGPANKQTTFLISNACGTFGYIDPDFLNTGYLTQRSDVYSFGVVLFEVLSGRPTIVRKYKDNRVFLTNLIKTHWRRKTLDDIIYSDLQKQIKTASLLTFTTIAYQCLMSGNERPTMKKVVEQLQKALNNQITSSDSDDSGFAAHLQEQSGLSASSPQSTHVSSSQSWEYDVFISFRREDTRKTFIDHVYSNLAYQHIITYRDDHTISKEASATSSFIKGVQKSRIAIIFFTQSYASSSCCLDELAFIIKNSIERGQIVFPIFYDVKPSEVIKQTGLYGAAFERHELKYNNNKVQSWRDALSCAGVLAGCDCCERRNINMIYKICDKILARLSFDLSIFKASCETSANTYLIGMETRMQELKSLLEVGSGGVYMVGICGMWGSGKSTLASSVYDEISHEFEGSCFVKNVRARSRMHGLKTLQEEILSNVLKSKVTLTNLEQGKYMMETRLRKNSVLIVLDDVHHTDHLKMLAGSQNWFGSGSRVIFTTRNRYLLNDHNFSRHNVRMLDDTEAIEVFSWHAFGKREPLQGFEKDSLYIVSKCGGHPSALKNLGSFLNGKRESVLLRILKRLEGIPVDEILKKFKIRDDGVDRNIFDRLLD